MNDLFHKTPQKTQPFQRRFLFVHSAWRARARVICSFIWNENKYTDEWSGLNLVLKSHKSMVDVYFCSFFCVSTRASRYVKDEVSNDHFSKASRATNHWMLNAKAISEFKCVNVWHFHIFTRFISIEMKCKEVQNWLEWWGLSAASHYEIFAQL